MIRGIQRQTMVIRTQDSAYFEEVQFLLRPIADGKARTEGDILREAETILRESGLYPERRRKKRKGSGAMLFLCGVLSGGGTVGLLWLILALL